MANISADLPSKKLWQTGTLKMLTGNDTVTAEEKFKQPFSFKNPAKLFFSTNKIPETTDDTPAFFRRWVLIVCNNVFVGEKCNPHIIEEITTKEEMSGLLNWSLEGLDRLLKNGRFSTTENLEDIRNEYIRKSNSAKAYIEENLVYENDPAAIIPANELYSNYVIYCQKQELPSMPKRSFTQNMEQWLPQAKNTTARINNKVIRVWQFVKIVTDVICLDMPIVTDVTEVLPKREKSLFLEGQSVTNKEKVVTDGEVKKNGKVCLSGASVTSVTKCHNCGVELNGVIGRDKEGRPLCLTCERAFRIEGSE
jgi:putative DNA primase/helicase